MTTLKSAIDKKITDEMSGQIRNSDRGFRLRDKAIVKAMTSGRRLAAKGVNLVVDELQTPILGYDILSKLNSGDFPTKRGAFDLVGGIVSEVAGNISDDIFHSPKRPPEDAMCIRYLTPEKWLWLTHQRSLRFAEPKSFNSDKYDSVTPNVIMHTFLSELCSHSVFSGLPDEWISYAVHHWLMAQDESRARHRISCWNLFERYRSHLMWSEFASNHAGVALICSYRDLMDAMDKYFTSGISNEIEWVDAGLVNYNTRSLVEPPFFKRPEFKDEREVRFVAQVFEGDSIEIPLHMFADNLKVITPPDAPEHHTLAIQASWSLLKSDLKSSASF